MDDINPEPRKNDSQRAKFQRRQKETTPQNKCLEIVQNYILCLTTAGVKVDILGNLIIVLQLQQFSAGF